MNKILQSENLNNQVPESVPKSLETNYMDNIGLRVCPPVSTAIRIGRVCLQKREYIGRGSHILCCRLYLGTTLPSHPRAITAHS